MNAIPQYLHISEEDYYALEEKAGIRHEYFNGEIFDMAGGTPLHARLIASVTAALGSRLRGHACYPTSSDQRIKIERTGLITYPDLAVVCPPERYDPSNANTLLNPRVVVEVLSETTEQYDTKIKLEHYRQIDSLTHCILVRQDRVEVVHHYRTASGEWASETHQKRSSALKLQDLGLELPLDLIYERLELPEG